MARNKTQKPLTEDPPEPDSSDEETSSSSTEVEEEQQEQEQEQEEEDDSSSSDSSDEENPVTPPPPPAAAPSSAKKTLTTVTTTTTTKKLPSDDSSDDDEPPVATMLKPVKPTVDASPSKPRSRVSVAALPSEKRPLDNEEKGSSKKPRKEKGKEKSGSEPLVVAAALEEGSSKKLFQRIFSEDDEIEILKGMLEFKAKKGADPMNDVDGFYEFIKKSVHADVNKGQIVDKIRRLKKKFFNAKKKKLSNPHDLQSFLLSKKIWGMDDDDDGDEKIGNGVIENNSLAAKSNSKARNMKSKVGNSGVLENLKAKEEGEEEKDEKTKGLQEKKGGFECGEFVEMEELRQEGLRKMGGKARAELKEMWRKMVDAEMKVKLMRDEAQVEETRRIVEALKSGKP